MIRGDKKNEGVYINDKDCDSVFIYYGGHGVEVDNKLNAVLINNSDG